MNTILTVTFGDGDLAHQLFGLKLSALRNHDVPTLWRLTELLIESIVTTSHDEWPHGYVSDSRLFDIPVDYVREMPHLLCEDYVIYPYTIHPPRISMH